MSERSGSRKIASVGGVDVFVHWSLPAIFLLPFILTRFEWVDSLCYGLALLFLIVAHELGHVLAARTFRLKVYSLELSGYGGQCTVQAPRAVSDTWWVFSAGLWVQMALLLLTWLAVVAWGTPSSDLGRSVLRTFVFWNVWMMVLNIIPSKTLRGGDNDGAVLWQLFLHVRRGRPHPFPDPAATTRLFPPETSLLSIGGFNPAGFKAGIEMLNDEKTPMEWVVAVLTEHLGLTRDEAVQKMLEIHQRGGALFPVDDLDQAKEIARAVTEQGRLKGHPLVVRAVEVAS